MLTRDDLSWSRVYCSVASCAFMNNLSTSLRHCSIIVSCHSACICVASILCTWAGLLKRREPARPVDRVPNRARTTRWRRDARRRRWRWRLCTTHLRAILISGRKLHFRDSYRYPGRQFENQQRVTKGFIVTDWSNVAASPWALTSCAISSVETQ